VAPVEMAHSLRGVVQKLSQDPSYMAAFEKAFGPGPITYEKVEKCIASFERTVLSGNSAFDHYYYGHDQTAMTPAQIRGRMYSAIRGKETASRATRSARSRHCSPTTSCTTSVSA
jgi:cytochrome c peroxidase